MTLRGQALFATDIAGPMIFTFDKILSIEQRKLKQDIQSNGGQVVEYSQRNKHTIVLSKPGKQSSDEIQFDVKYIKDCLIIKKILPLETYRLGKKVKVSCCYSKPFGSKQCIYANLILQGKCKKHLCVSSNQSTEEDYVHSDNDAMMKQQLEFIENLIYVERKPQVKVEPDSVEEPLAAQESQSFGEQSQSLLRKKLK